MTRSKANLTVVDGPDLEAMAEAVIEAIAEAPQTLVSRTVTHRKRLGDARDELIAERERLKSQLALVASEWERFADAIASHMTDVDNAIALYPAPDAVKS